MTLHLLYGRWWKIVFLPYGALLNWHKGSITGAVCGILSELTYPRWYTRFTCGIMHYGQDPQRSTWYCPGTKVINLYLSDTHSATQGPCLEEFLRACINTYEFSLPCGYRSQGLESTDLSDKWRPSFINWQLVAPRLVWTGGCTIYKI